MADLKTNIEIAVTKSGDGAARVTADLREVTASAQSSISVMSGLKAAFAGAFAIGAVGILRDSVKAFAESEEAANRLSGTLRARGQYTDEYAQSLKDLADSLKEVSVHGDEAILDVATTLVSFGAARSQVEKLTRAALDLSAGLRIDLSSAANTVGKAIAGEVGTLSRWGFAIDDAADNGEKLRQVLDQIQQRFGGLARGETETLTGQVKRLSEAWGDLKEQIGKAVVPVLTPAVSGLSGALRGANAQVDRAQINDGFRNVSSDESMSQARHLEELLKADLKVEKSLERQKQLRDAIRELIISQKRLSDADVALGAGLGVAVLGGTIHAGFDLRQRREDANASAARLLNPAAASSSQAEPPSAPSANQLKALADIEKLQVEMRINALAGFEKERASAQAMYDARIISVNRLADAGRVEGEVRLGLLVANEKELETALQLINARDIEKTQSEQMRDFHAAESAGKEAAGVLEKQRRDQARIEIEDFESALEIAAIKSTESKLQLAQREYDVRAAFYRRLLAEGKLTQDEFTAHFRQSVQEMSTAQANHIKENKPYTAELIAGYKEVGKQIELNFAGGLARTTVQAIGNFKNIGTAFKQFASGFLKQVAEMILQWTILTTIRLIFHTPAIFGAAEGGIFSAAKGGVFPRMMASGGVAGLDVPASRKNELVFPRMMASGGVAGAFDLDQATYFPRHNVVAGEAGRETLAVLSRPRAESFGGVQAVSGLAAGNEVSIVGRSGMQALAGAASGRVRIEVAMEDGLRSKIINDAAGVSISRVDQRLSEDSRTSRAVRQLVRT